MADTPLGLSLQYDWPNPVGYDLRSSAQPSIYLKTYTFSGGQRFFRSTDKFFGPAGKAPNYDWPNPIGHDLRSRAQPSVDLRTYIFPGGQRYLRTKDKFFGLAGHPNYDWPVVRAVPRGDVNYVWPSTFFIKAAAFGTVSRGYIII